MRNPNLHTIYERLTYRYITEYSDQDKWDWDYPMVIKELIGTTRTHRHSDGDTTMTIGFHVIAKHRYPIEKLMSAIQNYYTKSGCTCSHDCCGCTRISADVRKVGKRQFFVHLRVNWNY